MSKRSQADAFKLQQQAQQLLREGCSTSVIAAKLGVSPRTVQRWVEQSPLQPLEKLRHGGNFEVIEGGLNEQQHDYTAQSPVSPNMTTQEGMSVIGCMLLQQLGAVLADPDLSTTNRLKALSLGGEWCGFARGLASNVNVAIATIEAAGFHVVDPSQPNPNHEAKQNRGLTPEVVHQIKSQILGFTVADDLSEEDDPAYVEPLEEPITAKVSTIAVEALAIEPDAIIPTVQSETPYSERDVMDLEDFLLS